MLQRDWHDTKASARGRETCTITHWNCVVVNLMLPLSVPYRYSPHGYSFNADRSKAQYSSAVETGNVLIQALPASDLTDFYSTPFCHELSGYSILPLPSHLGQKIQN